MTFAHRTHDGPSAPAILAEGHGQNRKHLLGLVGLSRPAILDLLRAAERFVAVSDRPIKQVPALRGRTVVTLFLEPSTRTRAGFELAAQRLSADLVSLGGDVGREALLDQARALDALQPDVIVLRHPHAGAAHLLARTVNAAVVNAGDGAHEHPTQGLADCLTLRQHLGGIEGARVVVLGDLARSRAARSSVAALATLGAQVVVCGPPTLVPAGIESLGCQATFDRDGALEGADAVLVLPLSTQHTTAGWLPDEREYSRFFGLDRRALQLARPKCVVLHPGPIRRGVEIAHEVADGPQSRMTEQLRFGLAARMSALFTAAGGEGV